MIARGHLRPGHVAALVAVLAVLAVGLRSGSGASSPRPGQRSSPALPASYVPLPFGRGPRYRPAALGAAAAEGRPIGAIACRTGDAPHFGAHLELFVHGRVVAIPPGIGFAPPIQRQEASVIGGRCQYAVRTREPTGVIEVETGPARTLGDFFAVWGQPLSKRRLLSFPGRVRAFIAGTAYRGDPRAIPLTRHAVIALELGRAVAPHPSYLFPPGL